MKWQKFQIFSPFFYFSAKAPTDNKVEISENFHDILIFTEMMAKVLKWIIILLHILSDDDSKPKRLSLRERMALQQKGVMGGITSPDEGRLKISAKAPPAISNSPLKKYRESREMAADDALEVGTRRRVVRVDENGNEEVTIRDRTTNNKDKDDVKRDIERKSRNFDVSFHFPFSYSYFLFTFCVSKYSKKSWIFFSISIEY